MTGDDLAGRFAAILAEMYPGVDIDAPLSISVGGESDTGRPAIDFGIVKEAGGWRVPERYRDLAEPILMREAYRAGFPAKTTRSSSMIHACNWFAWKSIGDRALKKRFFDAWLAAATAESPSLSLYAQPPALIREIDKFMNLDVRELHDLLVRYSAENERLLGKQLRHDAAEHWALSTAIDLAPVPQPAVVELLHAFTTQFLETREVPSRAAIIERAASRPRFGGPGTARGLEPWFPAFSNYACTVFQSDPSLIGKRFVALLFAPGPGRAGLNWDEVFHVPGMFLHLIRLQGDILGGGDARGRTYLARFMVPTEALDPLLDFVSALAANGFFSAHKVFTLADTWTTVNFNAYAPVPLAPSYCIDPIRDEPDLFLRAEVKFCASPKEASSFLSYIAGEGIPGMRAFIDKVLSPYTFAMARQDSWLASLAAVARVPPAVARRWYDAIAAERRYVVPEPRCSYMYVFHVPVFSHLVITTRAGMAAAERERLARLFPSSLSTLIRGVRAGDATLWTASVPRGKLRQALDAVHGTAPEARVALVATSSTIAGRISIIGWLGGDGYGKAAAAVSRFVDAVPKLARGEWSLSRYANEAAGAAERDYSSA